MCVTVCVHVRASGSEISVAMGMSSMNSELGHAAVKRD